MKQIETMKAAVAAMHESVSRMVATVERARELDIYTRVPKAGT